MDRMHYIDMPFEWHDSIFQGFDIQTSGSGGLSSICMTLNVHVDPESPVRVKYRINLIDVVRLTVSIDFRILQANEFAGNISNGFVRKEGGLVNFRLFLADGYMDIFVSKWSVDRL